VLCVLKYNDLNGDATRDVGEPLLGGVRIIVRNSSGGIVGTYTTNGISEPFCFNNLTPGLYIVTEVIPSGYSATTPSRVGTFVFAGFATNVEFGNRLNTPTNTPTRTPTKTPLPAPTATPTGMIPDPVAHPKGMVSDTSRNHLFTSSKGTNAVVVWDEVAQQILKTIPVGSQPWGLGLVNNRVYVANYNSASVSVIDAATLNKMPDISLNTRNYQCSGGPANIAVNPNTNRVYVALYGNRVAVIDATTNTPIDCISTNSGTFGVAVNPTLNQLYVTNRDGFDLMVFDISTNPAVLIQDVPLGGSPFFVQANPNWDEVYVMVALDADYSIPNNLRVFSATSGGLAFQSSAFIGNTGDGGTIWVSQATGNLYIAANGDNQVQVVDPITLSVCATTPASQPFGLTENVGLGRMYIGNIGSNVVTAVSDNLCGP